jgi:hypothetical protein
MQKYDTNKPYYREHPLLDTAKACIDRNESTCLYLGGGKPHFQVPALVSFRPITVLKAHSLVRHEWE